MADVKTNATNTIKENIKSSLQLISEHLSGEQELEDLKEEAVMLNDQWDSAYEKFGVDWGGKIEAYKAKVEVALQKEKKRKQRIAAALNSD